MYVNSYISLNIRGTVHYIWEGRGWVIKWGDLKFSGRSGGGGQSVQT